MYGELGVGACKGGRAVATQAHPVCLQRSWPHPCLGFGGKKPWLAVGLDQKSGFSRIWPGIQHPVSLLTGGALPKILSRVPNPPERHSHTKSLSWSQSCSNKDQPDTSFRHRDRTDEPSTGAKTWAESPRLGNYDLHPGLRPPFPNARQGQRAHSTQDDPNPFPEKPLHWQILRSSTQAPVLSP